MFVCFSDRSNIVGHESFFLPHVLPGNDGGFAHRRMRIQHRLDFAQLDPESAQFDLMINAPQALDRSVWPPPRQIARGIQPGRTIDRDKGVGYEFFRRQLRAVEIAPCQAVAAQVQFARRTDGHWLQVRIKDVRLSISQRFADADRDVGASYLASGGQNGGLGRTVKVPEARPFWGATAPPVHAAMVRPWKSS